jgi:hypothetical protein
LDNSLQELKTILPSVYGGLNPTKEISEKVVRLIHHLEDILQILLSRQKLFVAHVVEHEDHAVAEIGAGDDHVDEAVILEEFGALEAFG